LAILSFEFPVIAELKSFLLAREYIGIPLSCCGYEKGFVNDRFFQEASASQP
jgi:hypothetical protein